MNRAVFVTIAAVLVLGGLWLYSTQYPIGPRVTNFEECEKAGYDIFLSFPAQCVTPNGKTFIQEIKSFEDCEKAGYPILTSYPRQCRTSNGKTFIENIGNVLEKADLIQVDIQPNQEIRSPFQISGKARGFWFFEADFPIELLDSNGKKLGTAIAKAEGEWMTNDFVQFKAVLNFEAKDTKGTLVFRKDNASGLPEHDDALTIPVNIEKPIDSKVIKVEAFFPNSKLDPDVNCEKVFAVEREIPKLPAVGRLALEELLKGLSENEIALGYSTNINSGVKVQKLTIENGLAKVDFNDRLNYQVGGACRVIAIRAQIEETLKQFPTVNEVIISINGRTEDILEP